MQIAAAIMLVHSLILKLTVHLVAMFMKKIMAEKKNPKLSAFMISRKITWIWTIKICVDRCK